MAEASNTVEADTTAESREDFPSFVAEDGSVNVKVNTDRLESYLQTIKRKLRMHDTSLQEQMGHVDKISKADDAKIARLAVKLDHCMMDINNFKDTVLTQRTSAADMRSTSSVVDLSDIKAELTSLSALVRRTELSQAESLDSFSQIKQLTSTLKAVTRQLDSLGRNSVILELRTHVDKVVASIRSEVFAAQTRAEEEWSSLREQLECLEQEKCAALDQRISAIEDKAVLYDLLLSDQQGEELSQEQEESGCEGGEATEGTNANTGDDQLASTAKITSLTATEVAPGDEAAVSVTVGADGRPLRPSEMLLLDIGASFRGDGEGSPGSHVSSQISAREATDVAGELWGGSRQSGFGSSSQRSARLLTAGSTGPLAAGARTAVQDAVEGSALVRKTRHGSSGGGARSSFFNSLMGQYISRAEFTETIQEMSAFARKSTHRLRVQLQQHAVTLLFRIVQRIQRSVLLLKRQRAFTLFRDNVRAWHTVRNRRNRAKALMFQARLEKLCPRRVLLNGFRYWARVTHLFCERERLRLWLRNVLQHWINMRVINVRIYLNRWKRSTVHSYHSSLFAGDVADLEATGN
jgi:hypothetical protein